MFVSPFLLSAEVTVLSPLILSVTGTAGLFALFHRSSGGGIMAFVNLLSPEARACGMDRYRCWKPVSGKNFQIAVAFPDLFISGAILSLYGSWNICHLDWAWLHSKSCDHLQTTVRDNVSGICGGAHDPLRSISRSCRVLC